MTVSMKRSRLRRRALTPRIRTLIAHVHLDSVDAGSDEEGEDGTGTGTGTVAAAADRPLEDDDGYERVLRERRRRHFTRLCVEQLYRFEEA